LKDLQDHRESKIQRAQSTGSIKETEEESLSQFILPPLVPRKKTTPHHHKSLLKVSTPKYTSSRNRSFILNCDDDDDEDRGESDSEDEDRDDLNTTTEIQELSPSSSSSSSSSSSHGLRKVENTSPSKNASDPKRSVTFSHTKKSGCSNESVKGRGLESSNRRKSFTFDLLKDLDDSPPPDKFRLDSSHLLFHSCLFRF